MGAMRVFQGPNLVCLTRANVPPVPGQQHPGKESPDEAGTSVGTLGNKRELRGMSRASSLSLARLLSILDWRKNGQCVHCSLTYGRIYPATKSELALTKKALQTALQRAGACGVWRLEYQKRLAPHWHVMAWIGDKDVQEFEIWLRSWWSQHSGNHHFRGVKVTSGDQARGTWYLAMHAAKREQSPPFAVGRWWGFVDRQRVLDAGDLHCTAEVQERERVWWSRLYRRATGARVRNAGGFSWFLPRTAQTQASAWILNHIDWEKSRLRK